MDASSKSILNKTRELIIKDLHGDVIDSLHEKGVLYPTEYREINSLNLQEKRNEKLLDILVNKSNGLKHLKESLKDWYYWIDEKLTEHQARWDYLISQLRHATPKRNVSRTALLKQTREALKELTKGKYVVLHGMSGCGKTCLAADAIHHDILLEKFEGKVIWLYCGQDSKEIDNDNHILNLLNELNEEIGADALVSDVNTVTVKTLSIKMAQRVKASEFEGLLVLDGVCSANVIEALNVGCKTLVTTTDKDVMKNRGDRYHSIKVDEGFTKEESMKHLSLCVDLPVEKLPHQAQQIHLHAKGHPLIMSLIGAQLDTHQEEARTNPDSWKPYLDVLVNKDYGQLKRKSYDGKPILPNTIKLCINNLDADLRGKYQDFALFVEDVNIKTEVLEILWGLSNTGVKQIMTEFRDKSLIVCKYNASKQYYVYGIHDILLYYLKKQLSKEEKKNLHLKLINRYQEVSKGNVANLPKNDNYFLYFVGYHLANAELYKLFPEWYFNLEFIEAKLKLAGPGDLLLDYKRYSQYFSADCYDTASITQKLTEFVRFVESAGLDVKRNNGPDIVQLALQEPHDSAVYLAAIRLAQSRPNNTYLRFKLGPSNSRSDPLRIQTKEKVSSACFLEESCRLIVAFESGIIQVMDQKGYITRVYEGHNSRVPMLSVSRHIFLSVSKEIVKVWKLPFLDSSTSDGRGDRTPSPSQMQKDFTAMFSDKSVDKRKSWLTMKHEGTVDWACFSSNGSKMASCCSEKNRVEVWEMSEQNGRLGIIHVQGTSCIFSHNDENLIIGCSNSKIFIHSLSNNTEISRLVDFHSILALFSLPDSANGIKFGALTKATLCVWGLEHTTLDEKTQTTKIPCHRVYSKTESEYTCCAATPDGKFVAVATSNGKILIFDLNDGSVLRKISHYPGKINYLAMDSSHENTLLACFDDATIRLWTLGEVVAGNQAVMKTNFVVAWTAKNLPIIAAPTDYKPGVKKILANSTTKDLSVPDSVNDKILLCGISMCGKYIVSGTRSGGVYLHFDGFESEMVKIFSIQNISKLKVELIQTQVCVLIGLADSIVILLCMKDDISKPDRFSKFEDVGPSDRLVDCFILQKQNELITVSQNGIVQKCSLQTGKLIGVSGQAEPDVTICDCDLSPDLMCITLDSRRNLLNLYNLQTMAKEKVFQLYTLPSCCSISLDSKKVAVGFQSGLIQFYDLSLPEAIHKDLTMMQSRVHSVCVSRSGVVGAATSGRVVIVTAGGGIGQAKLRVQRLAMSPDDSTVLTVDADGHTHLIDDLRNMPAKYLDL